MGFLSNLFGGGPKTTVVQSKIPEELAPYVTEVNKEQQELYRRRLAERPETYQYQGQTIADLTQDQLDARGGIRGLVGSTADDYALARQGITGGDEKFKTDILLQFPRVIIEVLCITMICLIIYISLNFSFLQLIKPQCERK